MSQTVDSGNVIGRGLGGQVHCFRNGIVDVLLKSGLHANVMLRWNLECGDEQATNVLRDRDLTIKPPVMRDGVKDVPAGEFLLIEIAHQQWVELWEGLLVEDICASVGQGKKRLDAGTRSGDDADCAGRRNRCLRSIA